MSDYREVTKTIEVPQNTGIPGFLHTIKEILKYPRVQSINIDSRGRVTYSHFVRVGQEPDVHGVDFEFLQPYAIVRNGDVAELEMSSMWGENAATVVAMLFEAAAREQLQPVAFVGGANTNFWSWHRTTTGIDLSSRTAVYGLPFLTDRHCDDSTLLLCAAYGKDAAFIDTRKSFRVVMDTALPNTTVDIL